MKSGKFITFFTLAVILMMIGVTGQARAQQPKCLFSLCGLWKFEIGDNMRRAEPGFNDSKWESINAPAAWEDEGFPGYDGYAWYRKHFKSSGDWYNGTLTLNLGFIDDVDEVFLNGHLIGSTGLFPPEYSSAYNIERIYPFSPEYLSPNGDNVIAIRVYDAELSGGILRGKLGVYNSPDPMKFSVKLVSGWKFTTGDDQDWKSDRFDDSRWEHIIVPAYWEPQGHSDYDGFAWYRVKFQIPADIRNDHLILLLGKIDDYDETFLNGEEIGHTGNMATRRTEIPGSNAYTQLREYSIPPDLVHSNGDNVLAVRVYDGFKDGGIYSGPIGIVTRDEYLNWKNKQREPYHFFDWLFK